MTTTASHHHLVAEAIAFPLWHESALRHAKISLTRSAVGVSTDPLAAACTEHLRARANGASLPQLAHLRDQAWFHESSTTTALAGHVARVAREHLEHRGLRVGLRQDHGAHLPELTERWRWLSLALPSDLLVAALAAELRVEPPAEHVELVTTHLARTLLAPCAETHLHVGAAIPFGVLWTGLAAHLSAARDTTAMVKTLSEKFAGSLPFDDPDRFLHLLRSAALGRVVMAAFLLRRSRGSRQTCKEFLDTTLPQIAARVPWTWGRLDALRGLRSMLSLLDVPTGPTPASHGRSRSLLAALTNPPRRLPSDPLEALVASDPLASSLPPAHHATLPETRFLARGMEYLLDGGRRDDAFAKLFWQYNRVRGATFRLLVQDAGTAGLDWFTGFYNRISFFRDTLPKHRGAEPSWIHALATETRDLNLGALETRTRPDERASDVRDLVRAVARQSIAYRDANRSRPTPEIGLVLHFIKATDYKVRGGPRRLHADPRNRAFGARHGVWFDEQRRRAIAIAGALRNHPELLLLLRGIDVANLEQAQPTWVIVPLYDIVREASREASQRLARALPSWRVPPMRATLHAGEDCLRLVEGVRRMHEAIEFGLLRQGDRFGHGLAVGTDPDGEEDAVVSQPREDRLDDLLWELDRYACRDIVGTTSRVEYLRREIHRIASDIYLSRDADSVEHLIEARRLRHSARELRRLRYPTIARNVGASHPSRTLLLAHLTDPDVFRRGRTPVEVRSAPDERAMLAEAQRWLRRELARREITIESNPSSNLLIGDLHAINRHPAMRLQPIVTTAGRADAVQLSVNTDNPVTFASCLADEFAFIYAAMLERGVTSSDALAWIDRRREDGWRSRFTLEGSANDTYLRRLAR